VAIANARLLQTEREAAETSSALLALSQVLTRSHTVGDILQEALETIPTLVPCAVVGAYVADDRTGGYRLARLHQVREGLARARRDIVDVPPEVVAMFTPDGTTPFVISREMIEHLPADLMLTRDASETLIAPLAWEPDGAGALVLTARDTDATFTERDLPLAKGIADITSLALGNARRLSELERFHELVETLDAVFWEAGTTDLGFRFVGGRTRRIAGAEDWPPADSAWGDHIAEPDRPEALTALRAAIQLGEDRSLEYRVARPDGETAWVRDLVHLVRGIQGPRLLRGLMVDVTERKRAEQALRQSERKYSEAFLREREAAQRLRSLDEMKNTFLEAVSHDLRTPLTSILGSALTLEQTGLDLPRADALDLVHRVAANARKLERLLADLLDLDRLQRGIVTPQRRPTALPSVLDRVLDEADPKGHSIDAEADDVTVSVDAGKLERILENLLSNALRHTPPGASVWVRLRADDDGVRIVVEDDGPGIPTELREAVFEPFRQVPGSAAGHSPGVGIGLSLVRRFAELHGGRAWVEDRPGGGASFRVTLPSG
jgi:PAS domain S-box-containing protein